MRRKYQNTSYKQYNNIMKRDEWPKGMYVSESPIMTRHGARRHYIFVDLYIHIVIMC
jgi:hypothetical protein